jgi:FKBP-type peptidyl-prolyl cis-trans isomerase
MDDTVAVNYTGTLIDGTEFDSSRRLGRPAEFPIKGVIPGWTEGLQLMKKGGKAKFFVPPELGYGDRPRQQIPPNAVLIFDVELLDVKASPPPPKPAGGPGPKKGH